MEQLLRELTEEWILEVREVTDLIVGQLASSSAFSWVEAVNMLLLGLIAAGTYAIAFVNNRSERIRRTADLIKSVITDPIIFSISARVYRKRHSKEGDKDPYENEDFCSYAHDLSVLLNFFETVCIEVNQRTVHRQMAKEHLHEIIVNTDKLVEELERVAPESNAREGFAILLATVQSWKASNS